MDYDEDDLDVDYEEDYDAGLKTFWFENYGDEDRPGYKDWDDLTFQEFEAVKREYDELLLQKEIEDTRDREGW